LPLPLPLPSWFFQLPPSTLPKQVAHIMVHHLATFFYRVLYPNVQFFMTSIPSVIKIQFLIKISVHHQANRLRELKRSSAS